MDHVALWEACDTQPLQQVGMFSGAESLLSGHADSSFSPSPYWGCDEIPVSDINLMSVEPLAFDPMMSLHPAESIQQPQWQPDYYPSQEVLLQEISNNGHFIPHYNPPAPAHVGYSTFGNVTTGSSSVGSYGGGGSSSNRPYGGGPGSSSSMFGPLQRIISTNRNVVVESSRRDCEEPPKMTSFNPGPYVNSAATAAATLPTPKPVSLPLPIPNSVRQHRQVSSSPVMNLSGFEPSPRPMSHVSSSPRLSQVSSSPRPLSQVTSSPRPISQVSSSPRPISQVSSSPGFEPSRPVSQVSSSPVMSMSYGEQQRVMSNSPSLSFDSRHPKSSLGKPGSSPIPTVIGFEPIPQSSSSPNVMGGPPQQRQQQQQPAMSTSPPLSNVSFEPRQHPQPPSMSNSPSTSNLVFEPRRLTPNPTPRQPATTSNINNNPRSDVVVEPAPKWAPPLRIVGNEKNFGPQTDTIKYPIPKSTSASSIPAPNALNPVHKRQLYMDDNKNNTQGGNMNKKPMQKWQGGAGCSRLEEISNAAHQKVTQNTSGRALGPALNTNLKPRARQGSANDPQSIAARVRRERISERLKVLQTLIPNGDKVDMVTMLEKAINYVQCLELQIRMLKNDSLWPKALGPLPNTLQELLELAGPEFLGGKDTEETTTATENKTSTTSNKKLVPAEVIEFDGNQPSADKE